MEDKFYTINQVAEILDMHHKTIRNFISNGKLRASKVGKQWRVSDDDLNSFMKNSKDQREGEQVIEFSSNETFSKTVKRKINVSTVLDIEEIDKGQYMRISNTLLAVMNSKDPEMQNSTLNVKYYEKDNKLKVLLWGEVKFMEEMLSVISLLVDRK
ncbi:helix-turn-helix domain-containing protein [Lachnoclostridium phytofermentans]|uniref:DNA binding domain protein, excisionase family n=1 Tax=Lachnoclostridium phytofermentans (strain ATCC 700394 / DSM 18823 / ISDg) TaxID=357809 RepID=A9KSC8_LACP7|nr:helix-turn-helix domain-containing protein [Lachnoclostridium phytofermentans]ABX42160.1 DNA binding domain protein, excisionase family [Lachnoclostridium phytofermentans ISDg]